MSFTFKENIDGFNWFEKETVTSTNDEIKMLVSKERDVVLSAIEQTKGRGRRGREWKGISGNLYFTYTKHISYQDLGPAVCIIGLSLAKVIKELSPKTEVKIKWPNDVYVSNKKISGILIENIQNEIWAIGIGVNIVSSPLLPQSTYATTSLKEEGIVLDRYDFLRYYLKKFADIWQQYQEKGFDEIKQQWLELALNYQKEVSILNENEIITGIFVGIDDNGYMMVKTDNKIKKILVGDVFIKKEIKDE